MASYLCISEGTLIVLLGASVHCLTLVEHKQGQEFSYGDQKPAVVYEHNYHSYEILKTELNLAFLKIWHYTFVKILCQKLECGNSNPNVNLSMEAQG